MFIGPICRRFDREPLHASTAADTLLYQILHIDGDHLRYEVRTAIGEIYDGFELHKQGTGHTNRLVKIEVPFPENLRPRDQ